MAATYSSLVGLAVGSKYEVRRVLGAGGMGVVCEAVHADLGKRVALKLIDKTMKESELIVARFKREARALGQIRSEHIVEVFDVGHDTRVGLYMVMEHLRGEDLQTRIERDKRLDVQTGVMIAHQIARGLAKAHAAGVVHRDLKPANVFLTTRDNGQLLVKLLDFGVSKLLADEGGARITGSGAPIGTPLYMSPEQAEGRDDTDARADIWSLGAVLYEALAGAPPFPDRGSYHGTIVGILTSRPKLLHDAAPWVPAPLAGVVDAMLVHDRTARIKDAETVTKRLLEAYPAVLPDGTGRHAVIVSHASAGVDTTGDTEIFDASALPPGMRASRPAASAPEEPRASVSPTSAPEDSSRTVPDLATGPGVREVSSAARTAAATPVHLGERASGEPASSGVAKKHASKTDPLPKADWGGASSSAGGVSMPETPPVMDPLPMSVVPDTMRDESIALRAERRRVATLAVAALAIVGVAIGGYFAGRRANVAPPPNAASATTAAPLATTAAPASASASASASATAPAPSTPALPITSVSALPSAAAPKLVAPRTPLHRRAKPAASASASAPPEEAPRDPDKPPSDPTTE